MNILPFISLLHLSYLCFILKLTKLQKAKKDYERDLAHERPRKSTKSQKRINIFFYIEIKKNIKGVKIIIFPWYVWGIVNIFLKKISWKYHSNDNSFLLSLNSDNITFPSCLGRIEINMIPPKM